MPFARDESDVAPPGPNYDKRILDPARMTPQTLVRRYYLFNNKWRHNDFVVIGHPFMASGNLRVIVRELQGDESTMYLSDMGIVPHRGRSFNPAAYTIALQDA